MTSTSDPDTTMQRIAALARRAAAQPDVSQDTRLILEEIVALSSTSADSPGESDVASTENQSL